MTMDEKEVIKLVTDMFNSNIEALKNREATDRQMLATMKYMDKKHNDSMVTVALGVSLGFGVIIAVFLFCLAIS